MKTDRPMHRKLIEEAFKMAEEDLTKEGIFNPKPTKLSEHLSDTLKDDFSVSFHAKNFMVYHHKIFKKGIKEVHIKQEEVIIGLCNYLGHRDFKEFSNRKPFRKKLIIGISIFIVLLVGFLVFNFTPKQKCMAWKEDHYEETNCNLNGLSNSTLKLYREERILNFKKIEPDCNTEFFTDKGIENLWYGKNEKGNLEFFTDQGLHPETGKTLKAITPYMIRKYICEDY